MRVAVAVVASRALGREAWGVRPLILYMKSIPFSVLAAIGATFLAWLLRDYIGEQGWLVIAPISVLVLGGGLSLEKHEKPEIQRRGRFIVAVFMGLCCTSLFITFGLVLLETSPKERADHFVLGVVVVAGVVAAKNWYRCFQLLRQS